MARPVSIPAEVKLIRRFNKADVERVFSETISKTIAELEDVLINPSAPSLEVAVARCMLEAIERGDQYRLEALLNRAVGPIPKEKTAEPSAHGALLTYMEEAYDTAKSVNSKVVGQDVQKKPSVSNRRQRKKKNSIQT